MNNIRDPFDLHRSPAFNILTGTARQAAAQVTLRVREAGAQALEASTQVFETGKQAVEDMSTFSIPKNVPSFTNPQREMENKVWGASGMTARSPIAHANGGVISGMQDRVGNLFEKNRDLPMYKDKPYSYASSRRRQPLWRRKRVLGVGAIFIISLLYFLGFFADDGAARTRAKSSWTWLNTPEKSGPQVDWMGRRERVKEAFTLSWDAYERYAWGEHFQPRASDRYCN
jgi:hypothetical protein